MPMMAETHIQNTAPGPPAAIASATPARLPLPTAPRGWYTVPEMTSGRWLRAKAAFQTAAKLANITKLNESGTP